MLIARGRMDRSKVVTTAILIGLTLTLLQASPAASAVSNAMRWTDINPNVSDNTTDPNALSSGGRINAIASARDGSTFYAASERGGLFKTTDGGDRWTRIESLKVTRMVDAQVDPLDHRLVIATSQFDGRYHSLSGISVSKDAGASWTKPPTASATDGPNFLCSDDRPSFPEAYKIAIATGVPSTIYVGTNCGVAISRDSGSTWTFVDPKRTESTSGSATSVWGVVAHAGRVDTCGQEGHWYSLDGGRSWAQGVALPRAAEDILGELPCSIAASPDEPYVLYATVGTALYETLDGVNWHVYAENPAAQGRITFFTTNPRFEPNGLGFDLWFGDVSLMRRACYTPPNPAPGGTTRCPALAGGADGIDNDGDGSVDELDESWYGRGSGNIGGGYTRYDGAHDDAGGLAFTSGAVDACPRLFGSDGGVFINTRTQSPACHDPVWRQPGIASPHALWLYSVTGSDGPGPDDEHVFMGAQDNGLWVNSHASGRTALSGWHVGAGNDGFDTATDGTRVLTASTDPFGMRLCGMEMTDCAVLTASNLPCVDGTADSCPKFQFQNQIESVGDKRFIVATGKGVKYTTDITAPAISWRVLGTNTPADGFCSLQKSTTGSTVVIYAHERCNLSTGGDLWKYVGLDSNGTWAKVTLTDRDKQIGAWAVDPNDANRLYAADEGNTNDGGTVDILRSDDGGATWRYDHWLGKLMKRYVWTPNPFFETVWNQPIMFAFDPYRRGTILAGGQEAGVFVTYDDGAHWNLLSDPEATTEQPRPLLPRPWNAFFSHERDSVYVATAGRGLWRADFGNASTSVRIGSSTPFPAAGRSFDLIVDVVGDPTSAVEDARVIVRLAPGLFFQSSSVACVRTGFEPLICEVGHVAAGQTRSFTIKVIVDNHAKSCEPLTTTAELSSDSRDADLTDNTASVAVRPVNATDLLVFPNPCTSLRLVTGAGQLADGRTVLSLAARTTISSPTLAISVRPAPGAQLNVLSLSCVVYERGGTLGGAVMYGSGTGTLDGLNYIVRLEDGTGQASLPGVPVGGDRLGLASVPAPVNDGRCGAGTLTPQPVTLGDFVTTTLEPPPE